MVFQKGKRNSPSTEFKKGRTPWNKEIYKNNPLIRNFVVGRMKDGWKKMNPSKKLEFSKECSRRQEKRWQNEDYRQKMSEILKRNTLNMWKNEDFRKNRFLSMVGKKRPKQSQLMKEKWKDFEFREKMIQIWLKGRFKRPTSLEQKFIEIIKIHNLPYKYTGNGSFLIGFKNPDFVNVNGEKICIEIRAREPTIFWDKCSPEEYKRRQIKHYSKYGWKCLVIFDDELKNENNYSEIIEEIQNGRLVA